MSKPDQIQSDSELPPADDKYVVDSQIEIIFILRSIMRKNTPVRLYFDQQDGFLLTSILGIDAERGKFAVGYGADDEINQRVLEAAQLIFVSPHNQARVQFVCHDVGKTRLNDRNALSIDIPESLQRIQKREYYRIATPAVNPLKCIIPLPIGSTPDTAEVMVRDISCGGVAVIDHRREADLEPGTTYENCRIVLPKIGALNVSIQVKSVGEVTLKNGLPGKQFRCEFVAMPEKMRAMIQRYILRLEREKKAK